MLFQMLRNTPLKEFSSQKMGEENILETRTLVRNVLPGAWMRNDKGLD